jgi:hypothetical protein
LTAGEETNDGALVYEIIPNETDSCHHSLSHPFLMAKPSVVAAPGYIATHALFATLPELWEWHPWWNVAAVRLALNLNLNLCSISIQAPTSCNTHPTERSLEKQKQGTQPHDERHTNRHQLSTAGKPLKKLCGSREGA